jgi:hypothetical protein
MANHVVPVPFVVRHAQLLYRHARVRSRSAFLGQWAGIDGDDAFDDLCNGRRMVRMCKSDIGGRKTRYKNLRTPSRSHDICLLYDKKGTTKRNRKAELENN